MANNSPTIVAASLSDDQLKKSIDSLVSHVDEAMKKMVQSTNNAVGEMEAKLKSLGNLKIDTGGSNDGGTGRRTQQHEKLTKAVNDASEAVSKETQKLQDLQQSLSGASDREQNFISQKERAASTIAQENELLSKQQSELAALKAQEQQLADAHQKDMQARQQNAAAIEKQRGQVKYYEEELNSLQAKLASAQAKEDRYWSVVLKARETISKSFSFYSNDKYGFGFEQYEHGKSVYHKTETEVRSLIDALSKLKEVDARHGFIDEIKRPYAEMMQPSRDTGEFFKRFQEEISAQIKSLQEIKKGLRGDARKDVDDKITAAKELLAVYKTLSSAQDSLNKTYSKENLLGASNVNSIKKDIEETKVAYDGAKQKLDQLTQATKQSDQIRQESLNLDAKIQEKEKEISETRGRIAAATKEQSEADKNASQAAKEKANIQSQVANQEKQVAEAKKQLTTATQQHTDAETKSSRATKEKTMTLDQQASAINTVVQSEKKYTDEVLRQAAAIRSSKEWQEKGHVVIGDVNYYDKERANVSKRDKQLLLSLEEQIVQAQQKETQEALVAAEAKRQQVQAAKEAAQAAKGVSSYDLGIDPNISAGRQRQIESTRKASKETEYLRQQVASLLDVEEREVKSVNMTTASYSELSQHLKQLQSAYNKLGADRIKKGEGIDIANEIQRTQRAMQKLQQTMSRPVSLKDALGGSEKTLDDIAYKMQRLASYRSGLNVDTQKKEITQVNDEYNRLKKRMDEVMQKNQQMIASNTALGRSWNYMKNRLAFYFTVGASTQFIKNLIEVRSQYEMNERALGILINSAERGTQIFNELSQMALVSPYTLIELSSAAKQLTAYDIAAKDVVNTTRRLADMAAAVGIPIERLTYALGQVKAYGYLNARDARMFANAGIPLVKNLSEYYTELEGRLVSTADIYDRIKKKQIGYEEVMSTISKMTDEGGKFFDFQAKMAETLKVQLANLTLAWNNMLNDMGEESQGVIVGGIGALKQMFLHWKDIEHILTEVVVTLGAYKAYQLMTTRLMGATSASLDAQILAMKRNNAAMLEKQALTRKLTVDELRQVAAQNQVTAADYRNALSGKQLTKQKALLLVALNKNNAQLRAAVVNMGLLTTQEVANITTGKALAIVFKSIGISIRNAALAVKAFMASMWPLLVIGAIYELYHAWDSYGEHVKEINKQAAEHAKEAFDNIKQYLESDVTSALQDRLAKGGKVESDAAGQKAWDEMREKIELSSSASNAFIAKLMQINDINERLAVGFDYLEDVQRVAGVMQTLEEDAVEVSSTTLGGLFGEGLKDDLQDYIKSIDILLAKYGDIAKAREDLSRQAKDTGYIGIANTLFDLSSFILEVRKTTDSIYNAASKEGLNISQQREFFEREISEIAQAEQMGAKETRIFRMQAEQEYYAYARAQLVAQLEYQRGAQKAATEKRIKDLDDEFGTNKALQESFFTWLTEKQDHAVKNMLRGKTQEEIKQGEWLKGSNAKWVEEMARKFSKEYGVSFDALHRLVLNANTWSINIPVFFQTIGQPLSDVQRDYEARTGKKFSSNPLIKDAKTQVEILDILKKKQKEVANEMATAEKAGGKYWEDNKQRYKEENDALVADIHAYNALTDAEEKANKKSSKGSKKDPLLDALKQEISLVEKLQSDYDKLSKSGASQADALDTIRGAYGKTIRLLNTQLQSYGLPQIDISQLITGKDPNKALAHFKQTLNTLVSKGMLTLERSKELEAVVEKFTLSAKTYNLDMITKGLNNELGKLKDEYELAVELDANPEMGNLFADWMGIDMSTLPHTAEEYAKRMTKALNKYLADEKSGIEIGSLLALTDDDLRMFQQRVDNKELNQVWVDTIVKNTKEARNTLKKENSDIAKEWDSLVQKYSEYEYKIAQVQRNANKERKAFALKYGSNAQKERALVLTTEIDAEKDQAKKQELVNQLKQLLAEIAGDDDTKLKIKVAIDKKELEEGARVSFEEFQKSPDWIVATGDLAGMTTKAIGGLIDSIESYKKKANSLTPKQIKSINNALKSLYKQQRSNNPFNIISNAIMEAKERAAEFQPRINEVKAEMDKITTDIAKGTATDKQKKRLEELIKEYENLINKQQESGKISATTVVEGINNAISAAQTAVSMFNKMAEAIGGTNMTEAAKTISDITGNIQAAGQGAAAGAQMGGGWGAAIGATAAGLTDLVTRLADKLSGNADISEKVEKSILSVKRLENAYKNLEYAAENAFGAATSGAQEAIKANKELQLVELKRQLALEQSRSSKNKDEDKIIELRGQIIDLEYEIKDFTKNAVNELLGISSHGDFFESMISEMIEAFKNGEDAMEVFEEKWSDMIDNMIMKTIVSQVLSQWVKTLERGANDILEKYTEDASKKMAVLSSHVTNLRTMDAGDVSEWIYDNDREMFNQILESLGVDKVGDMYGRIRMNWFNSAWGTGLAQKIMDAYLAMLDNNMAGLQDELDKQSLDATGELIDYYGEAGKEFKENYLGQILDKIQENWNFGQDSEKQLSQLQQGIQGISEDTGSALESYMNGVSQQVYYHSSLLEQIRDSVVGLDLDVSLGVQSQILLQLQSSYQVQMSIQGILEGVLNPSGRAFSVELVS